VKVPTSGEGIGVRLSSAEAAGAAGAAGAAAGAGAAAAGTAAGAIIGGAAIITAGAAPPRFSVSLKSGSSMANSFRSCSRISSITLLTRSMSMFGLLGGPTPDRYSAK